MQPHLYSLPPLLLLLSLGPACHGDDPVEGQNPGECADGADNDSDGQFDCDDPDCFGSPDCEADTDTDSDADTDTDTDSDADTDTGGPPQDGGGGAEFLEDEQDVGGSGDTWRPTSTILLSCDWLPQVEPGDWSSTLNCGPTSLVMAQACVQGDTPHYQDIVDLITWMDDNISTYGGVGYDYNGSYTNTTQLEEASEGYFFLDAERIPGSSLEDLWEELEQGEPAIIATYTQATNSYPSDEMVSGGAGHFMLLVGMTPTHIVVHDPGRSGSADGENRSFTIESFLDVWQGNSGVAFDSPSGSVTGTISYASVDAMVLTTRGTIAANEGLDSWSLLIAETVIEEHEYADGGATTSDSFDVEVDISDIEADPGEQTLELWVQDVDGNTGGGPVDQLTVELCSDADGDGYTDQDCGGTDCDDGDASIHPGAAETCDGEDDNCDGVVDETSSCWLAIYRFVDATTGAHCWNDSTSAPSACSGYAYELEAWIARATGVADTWHAVQCSLDTDHIIVEYDTSSSSDYTALQGAGYDCASADLGYIYDLGSGPASGTTPFASSCDLYRFSGTTSAGTGEHLFTRDETSLTGYSCELPVRGEVLTDHSCFGGVPSGC